ncbi:MAG: D-alanine--D-alanine ligase family protein [Spirochaetia bacterium]
MKVLLVFGGKSVEHEVSIRSAATIFEGLKKNNHHVFAVGIDKKGEWRCIGENFFDQIQGHQVPLITTAYERVFLYKENGSVQIKNEKNQTMGEVEIVFPIVHGTYGEDGRLQGFLQSLDVPFVGCDVCASACAMDKDLTKRILREAKIRVADWRVIHADKIDAYNYAQLSEELQSSTPFLKPNALGSSVGSGIIRSQAELESALREVFSLDRKALVETCIQGREIEFAVLGNNEVSVSLPGEITPGEGFYSYEGKYVLGNSRISLPAILDKSVMEEGQYIASQVYKVLGCEGMARVDFFLKDEKEWILNEVNTLPGFTSISMYPQMWQASGKPINVLLESLLELGMDRHRRQAMMRRSLS